MDSNFGCTKVHFFNKPYEARQLNVIPREVKMNQCDADGLYDIYWDNGERINPESRTLTGTLKALFEVRDGNNEENLKGFIEEVDLGATEVTVHYTNINSIADFLRLMGCSLQKS